MSKWFVRKRNKDYGPFTSHQLRGLVESGKLLESDKVRRDDKDIWVAASRIRGLFDTQNVNHSDPPRKTSSPPAATDSALDDLASATASDDGNVNAGASPPKRPPPIPPSRQTTTYHRKEISGLGIAGLVLGIIATLTCWVPFIGMLTVPFAALGAIFSIIGLVVALSGRRSSPGMSIAGLIVCLTAIGVAVLMTGSFTAQLSESLEASSSSIDSWGSNRPRGSESISKAWTPVDEVQIIGDIQCRVKSVYIHRAFGTVVIVEVTNLSSTKKISCVVWGGVADEYQPSRYTPVLTDNFGNSYAKGIGMYLGSTTSLYPEKSRVDKMSFERPVEGFEFLYLELPAENLDLKGEFRFQIPASFVRKPQ